MAVGRFLLRLRGGETRLPAISPLQSRYVSSSSTTLSSSAAPLTSYDTLSTPRQSNSLPSQDLQRSVTSNFNVAFCLGRHASVPGMRLRPVLALQSSRNFSRDLFMRANAEHAALNYLEHEYQGIAVISLNRSDARNAIGAEMLKQLHSILQGLRHSTSAQVLIVNSSVPGVFCAGADLKERQKMGFSETEKFVSSLRSTFSSLECCSKRFRDDFCTRRVLLDAFAGSGDLAHGMELQIPTIAVIEGAALGGGLELALACDLRVCGEEATFGLPETSLAVIPGAGGTQRLPRVIGRSRAKELIFTAERVDAKRAEALGLVDHCVMEGEAYGKALSIAHKVLAQGPLAVRVAKHAIDHGIEMDPTKGMLFEEACYSRLLRSKDRLEGLAAFSEKRKPVYRGE